MHKHALFLIKVIQSQSFDIHGNVYKNKNKEDNLYRFIYFFFKLLNIYYRYRPGVIHIR